LEVVFLKELNVAGRQQDQEAAVILNRGQDKLIVAVGRLPAAAAIAAALAGLLPRCGGLITP
jgi:hypothetical protein